MKKEIMNCGKRMEKGMWIVCLMSLLSLINVIIMVYGNEGQKTISTQARNIQKVKPKLIVKDVDELKSIVGECLDDSELFIVGEDYTERGNYAIDLSNGSWIVHDKINNSIVFQPRELGDWDYTFNNIDDAKKCITTYANNFISNSSINKNREI